MSVWIIRQTLSAEEEARILERPYILLPFEGIPNLSAISSPYQLRSILQTLAPDAPPESIGWEESRIWGQFTQLQPDDTVVVPLPYRRQVAIGQITGKYEYGVGDAGQDEHKVPIMWNSKLLDQSIFAPSLLANAGRMSEVTDREARIKIHDQMPHTYNRFAKWRWIAAILIGLQVLSMLQGMFRQ
jgi:predicted Mrr-cat superfamily restriction endonuclease